MKLIIHSWIGKDMKESPSLLNFTQRFKGPIHITRKLGFQEKTTTKRIKIREILRASSIWRRWQRKRESGGCHVSSRFSSGRSDDHGLKSLKSNQTRNGASNWDTSDFANKKKGGQLNFIKDQSARDVLSSNEQQKRQRQGHADLKTQSSQESSRTFRKALKHVRWKSTSRNSDHLSNRWKRNAKIDVDVDD